MKLLRIEVDGLVLFKNKIELDFFTDQKVPKKNMSMVDHLFGSVYTNNVLSFVGINASGKSSILRVISFVMDVLKGESINTDKNRRVLNGTDKVDIVVYVYDEKGYIYKLESSIIMYSENKIEKGYIFESEKLWTKRVSSVRTKKCLLDFNKKVVVETKERNINEEYLRDDSSIFISKSKENGISVLDTMIITDHNYPLGDFYPKEVIRFLDPSIEYIKDTKNGIDIKFIGKKKMTVSSPEEFKYYLSSGTIKGISIFACAIVEFFSGGYIIVDEIENHFNKEIVASLIRFFMSESINEKKGTLIFSTHYPELLDKIDRNDSIFIMRNRGGLSIQRLSDALKRNDLKKSEVFQSNYLEGTAPLYDTYIDLKKAIENQSIVEGYGDE